jgi:cytochrome P450
MSTPAKGSAESDTAALARDFDLAQAPADFIDDPYPYFAALRTHDPVHSMPGGILLTRYDDIIAVYRDARASSDKKVEFRPKLGDTPLYEHHTTSLVFNDPPLHTRVRRIIMGALNQKAIARMEADVVRLVDSLLERMADAHEMNFIDAFAAEIPIEVIGNLLGVPKSDRGPLRGWSVAILSGLEPTLTPEMHARGNRAVTEFLNCLKTLVAERRRKPGNYDTDVLTRLIEGEKDGERLSETELYHQCIFMLNAGHETTTNLIGNGMWLLLTHPKALAQLRTNPALVPSAIEEMLRFEGPIQLNNRRLTAPMALGGKTLVDGTSITISIGGANRDPAQFPDPDKFDVARKPNRHLAFGQGDHACSGMNVARMEGRVAFSRLLARFPKIELAGEPERDRRIRFRGFRKLPVRV